MPLQVQLVPIMQVFVRLDASHRGQTCGLCGNFNQNQADDFAALSGVVEGTGAAFANTWKTQASCPNAKNTFEDPCSLSVENENYAQHWCSLLTNPTGVFAACHATISPAAYYSNCMFDTCNCEKSEDCMCAALSSYVRACAARGVLLNRWRDGVCSKYMNNCPKSQSYAYVVDTCQPTCRSLSEADVTCGISFVPVDGCTCPAGTFLNDVGLCVPAEECPCYFRGTVVAPGEVVQDDGMVCSCTSGKLSCLGSMLKRNIGCAAPMVYLDCHNASAGDPGAECLRSCHTLDVDCFSTHCVSGCVCPPGLVADGNGGCVAEEDCPCVHNEATYRPGDTIRVDCNTCTCRNRRWECTDQPCLATCVAYGDGHFITFDGERYSFEGNCEYTLAQDYCGGNASTNGTFRIVTENVPCGTTGTTCSKAIKLFVESYELILQGGSFKVVERGQSGDLPYRIRYMGIFLVIETRSGMVVSWDRKTSVFIRLQQHYKGRVCGLCGNFDDNAINDFTTRSHSVVGDALEFGNSWKFSPTCPDAPLPKDPCTANPYRKSWAQKQCSIINSATFAACRSQVDSTKYYEACVNDACACDSGGDCECFCTAVAAYAQACHDVGVCISWRTPDICPLFCDYYNPQGECEWHYKPCGAPCLKTCRNPSGRCLVDLPGLEGCYPKCPPSQPFFSEDQMKCVAQCGCYDGDGNYHDIGTQVPTAENCQSCHCTSGGLKCTHNETACVCTYEGHTYRHKDIIYNTTDGLGACLTAICGDNGTIIRMAEACPEVPSTTPFTFTTTSAPFSTTGSTPIASTVCVREVCHWSIWYDGSHPEPGLAGGDFEIFESLRQRGYQVCQDPVAIECRAEQFPSMPLQELGQKVDCNLSRGLMCLNSEQNPPFCHNYEIRVLCCDHVPCSPSLSTSTAHSQATITTEPSLPTITTRTPHPGSLSSSTWTKATKETTLHKMLTSRPSTSSSSQTMPPSPLTTVTHSVSSTTTCQPRCQWTKWFDQDYPKSERAGGDIETYDKIRDAGEVFCEQPQDIQCEAQNFAGWTLDRLHQRVYCDVRFGLVCHNKDQEGLFPMCYNYKIRVLCCSVSHCQGPTTTVLPTTTWATSTTTTQTLTPKLHVETSTTPSFSKEPTSPRHTATLVTATTGSPVTSSVFIETSSSGRASSVLPTHTTLPKTLKPSTPLIMTTQTSPVSSPTGAPIVTESTVSPSLPTTSMVPTTGISRPATSQAQTSTPKIQKPSGSTTEATTTNGATHCQPKCKWTEWFDVDFPTSGVVDGDMETYENIRAAGGKLCQVPEKIECRAENYPMVSIDQINQVVTCSLKIGLICRNKDQTGDFAMCFNYNVRVLCCDDYSHCPSTATVPPLTSTMPTSGLHTGTPAKATESPATITTTHIGSTLYETTSASTTSLHTSTEPIPEAVTTTRVGTSGAPRTATVVTSPHRTTPGSPDTIPTLTTMSTSQRHSLSPSSSYTGSTTPTSSATSTSLAHSSPTSTSQTTPGSASTAPYTSRATSSVSTHTSSTEPVPTPNTTAASPTPLRETQTSSVQTSSPPLAPTTSETTSTECELKCTWTDWIDSYQPQPGRYQGDIETYYHIVETGGHLCMEPVDIECQAVLFPNVALEELGQVVQCDVDYGLICRNSKQADNQTCLNYHIRVLCCTEDCASTAGPQPTTTTTAPGTSSTARQKTTASSPAPGSPSTAGPVSTASTPAPGSPTTGGPLTTASTPAPGSPSTAGPVTTASTPAPGSLTTAGPVSTASTPAPGSPTTAGPVTTASTPAPGSPTTATPVTTASTPAPGSPTTAGPVTTASTPAPGSPTTAGPVTTASTPAPGSPTTAGPVTTASTPAPGSPTTAGPVTTASTPAPGSPTTAGPLTTASTPVPGTPIPSSIASTATSQQSPGVPQPSTPTTTQRSPSSPRTSLPFSTSPISSTSSPTSTLATTHAPPKPTTHATSQRHSLSPGSPPTESTTPTSSATATSTTLARGSPTSTSQTTTGHPSTAPHTAPTTPEMTSTGCKPQCSWTDWLDHSIPIPGNSGGEFETYTNIRASGVAICEQPLELECQAESRPNVPLQELGQVVNCSLEFGLICRNQDQAGPFKICLNYHIRVFCCEDYSHCPSTPSTTTMSTLSRPTHSPLARQTSLPFSSSMPGTSAATRSTSPGPSCVPQCTWTDWFDEDYPTPGPRGGDFETYSVLRATGHVFCERPQDIQCRSEKQPGEPLEALEQVVQCDVRFGLICRNNDQPGPLQYCHNFHIRLLCCNDSSHCATSPVATGSTMSPSSTPESTHTSPALTPRTSWLTATSSIGLSSVTPEITSTPVLPSSSRLTFSESTVSPGSSTPRPTWMSSPAFSPSPCFCRVFGQLFSPGDIIYNKTDRAGCRFYAMCNLHCDIDRFQGACPSSLPPISSTPTPPSPPSSGCDNAIPPRKVNESWILENCTVARCEGDNHVVLLEPEPVDRITCVNEHLPVKVWDQNQPCHFHYECDCFCSGWGHSHYLTFDGTSYTFLENCTSVLMREIRPSHGNLSILMHSRYCVANTTHCSRALSVHYNSMEIVLTTTTSNRRDESLILLDQIRMTWSFSKNGVSVSVTGVTMMAVDIPAVGASIIFDGHIFQIRLPYSLFNYNTEGQCGTCTNSQTDDCRQPDGTMAPTCRDMAQSWKVPERSKDGCLAQPSPAPSTSPQPSVSTMPTSAPCPSAPLCELMLSQAFAECHSLIPPSIFFKTCLSDHCQNNSTEMLCQSLEAYAALCRARGVCTDWRIATGGLCDFSCPPTKEYRSCGPVQPMSCESRPQSPVTGMQAEGCFCPQGQLLFNSHMDICVSECPCVGPDGFPKFPGERWVSNCQACVCDASSVSVRCEPVQCKAQDKPLQCTRAGYETVTRPQADNPCCPETLCVCNTTTCPRSPLECGPGQKVVSTQEEGECCPTFSCGPKLCTYNGTVYGVGATFLSVTPCHTCTCLSMDTQDPVVQCEEDVCSTTCPQGFEYTPVAGQCCGECVQNACLTPEGRPVQPDTTWVNRHADNCTEYRCEAERGVYVLTPNPTPCPDISSCLGTIKKIGCCYTCEEVDSCQVHFNMTILKHQGCATKAAVNVTFCEGSCPGVSRYSMESQSMHHECTCCQQSRVHKVTVTMQCPDGTSIPHTYTQVDECSCTLSCNPWPGASMNTLV